ncbi:MAG: glycine--tRNA ligase subunit beta [Elusimicrobia bacterium RIFOXYD12_FULL_66_9]|nr:MAG: glycine--tRNA ligase subunit beta [Elusimicrobia bacterium RIFOXYD12_FULL_66_9]
MKPLKKTRDFLLDVHTEPLPARFVAPALEQLQSASARWLEGRIEHGEIRASGTLRHLILTVGAVSSMGRDKTERFKGPKEAAWRLPDGKFTPAAEGFARKHGLSADQLQAVEGVLYAEVHSKGEPAPALLQAMVVELLGSLQFPKSMVWEETGYKFGRPIRAITALLGEKVVPVALAGIKSGRAAYGHPILAKAPTVLKDPSKHAAVLRQGLVIADPAQRREYLLKALELAAKKTGGRTEDDGDLIDETVFMVEHPVAVLGKLRDEHMKLPAALLKMVMKKQLKFFPVVSRDGALLPYFVGVRDGLSAGNELVREGYQRVLEARFNDAAFFAGRDRSSTLESKLPLLDRVTYQKALGFMSAKAARVESLTRWMGERLRSTAPIDERAASAASRLVYADLVSDVVKEFPELQGQMGGVYARQDGLDERVALAVEQFYFPVAAKTPVPATPEAAVVSLAGKLDSLAGCFAVGLIPTGSADPYALRRQALGMVRILLEKQLPLDLDQALEEAVKLQPVAVAEPGKLAAQLSEFVWGRVQSLFEDMSYAVDEIRSIREGALKDLPNAFRRLAAVRAVRREPAFEPLAASFKRAANILRQAKYENGVAADRALLRDQADFDLYDALVSAEGAANDRIVRGDFEGGLKSLVSVKPSLDTFFEKVMVMVEDEGLKRQRLALLGKLVRAFRLVADLSEIQTPA